MIRAMSTARFACCGVRSSWPKSRGSGKRRVKPAPTQTTRDDLFSPQHKHKDSSMTKPIPAGHEGLIPHLVCDRCADAIEFYKKAFGAKEIRRAPAPDGRIMHAEIRIGEEPVFLVDDFPEFCGGKSSSPKSLGGTPVTIHRFVEDCDAAIKRAASAGATV